MLGPNLFFKQPRMGDQPSIMPIVDQKPFPGGNRSYYDMRMRGPITTMPINPHQGAVQVIGHPRYGFHTMLNRDSPKPLPTAPAIVGGNVDWTKSKVSPVTLQLHNALSDVRPMLTPPALGSFLKLREPSRDSIHTY